MRTSKTNPEEYDPRESYAARQLSRYDMQVAGIVVYVVTMTMFFVVALVMMLFRNEPAAQARAHQPMPAISGASRPAAMSLPGAYKAQSVGQSQH